MKSNRQIKRTNDNRNYMIALVLLALISCMSSGTLAAQMTKTQIDSIVSGAMTSLDHTVGFAIGVVKDGKIVHAKGYGKTRAGSGVPVTADTPFGIASNSKAFTATALSILVEKGTLHWDDKVVKHIPEFKMYDDYVTNNFTVQDLLTHRSGLGLGAGDLMLFPDGSNFTMNDVLKAFQHFEPVSPFRSKFDYDNLLYLVAGELIARVSGKPWSDFIEDEILNPLQMQHSYANYGAAANTETIAVAHGFNGSSLKAVNAPISKGTVAGHEGLNGAAGGMWSSARDMCNWMLVQLNKGTYGANLDKSLFAPHQQDEMWRMHTPMAQQQDPNSPFKVHFSGYGLGWFLSDFNGFFKVHHSGAIAGMSSEVTLIPELDLGIVVLNNSDGAGLLNGLLGFVLLEEYLQLETGINWMEMAAGMQGQQQMGDPDAEEVWRTVAANKNNTVQTKNYVGVYEDDWFGKVEIFEKGGDLWFRSEKSPRLNGKMAFYKDTTFAIKWEYQDMNADALAVFTLSENGSAQHIKMKGISRFIDFSFDFQDLDLNRIPSPLESTGTGRYTIFTLKSPK